MHLIYHHILVESKGLWLTIEGKSTEIPLTEVVSHATSVAIHTIFQMLDFNSEIRPSDLT